MQKYTKQKMNNKKNKVEECKNIQQQNNIIGIIKCT